MSESFAKVYGVEKDRYPNWMVATDFMEQLNTLHEYSFLIRRPMLETVGYLKQLKSRLDKTPNSKFVIWGEDGCGKTTTLMYATDYCHREGFVILNFYKFRNWYVQYKEMQESTWNSARYDHVARCQTLLKEFLIFNREKLQDLKTHKDYIWSEREKTPTGSPLLAVVETGIERPVFAADCVGVLMKELRHHCQESNCKLATIIDGASILFKDRTLISRKLPAKVTKGPYTQSYIEESIAPDELSIVRNIKKMLRAEVPNSVVLCTADITDTTSLRGRRQLEQLAKQMKPEVVSYNPFSLLSQEGWETLAPFVPIQVDRYTKSELDVMIDYYVERRYIQDVAATESGRAEIHFLSARHPRDFMNYSHEW